MTRTREALIIIVSAPSGSGKTTVINRLLEKMPGMRRSVSYTTRQPREGETDKGDYIFVTVEEFREKIEKNEFLEWEENFNNYYGTSREQVLEAVEKGEDIILSIDVKGARKVKEVFPQSVSMFIMPPSVEELEARLRKRNTDKEAQVSLRLEESRREMEAADEYDYLIVNEELEQAVEELRAIIEAERKSREQNSKKEEK